MLHAFFISSNKIHAKQKQEVIDVKSAFLPGDQLGRELYMKNYLKKSNQKLFGD